MSSILLGSLLEILALNAAFDHYYVLGLTPVSELL
jgi:hypothetical protein